MTVRRDHNDQRVVSKVMLHFDGLHLSVVTVGELLTWAHRAKAPLSRLQGVRGLLKAATIHEVDLTAAEKFGELRAGLLDEGITVGEMDLFNASIALVHNLTMVTHNTQHHASIPGLTPEDWMTP
jgi:tRNA(fMet)-specific endonuclease VapC